MISKQYFSNDGTISVRYLLAGDIVNLRGQQKVKLTGVFEDEAAQVMTLKGKYIKDGHLMEVEFPVGYGLRLKVGEQFTPSDTVTSNFNSFRYALGGKYIKDINRTAFKYMADMEETLLYLGNQIEDDGADFDDKIYSFNYSTDLYAFLTQYAGYSGGAIDYDRYQEMAD